MTVEMKSAAAQGAAESVRRVHGESMICVFRWLHWLLMGRVGMAVGNRRHFEIRARGWLPLRPSVSLKRKMDTVLERRAWSAAWVGLE